MFIPDKSVDLVLAGEGRAVPFFMLMRAPSDVVRVAALERAILPIGEQIDIEGHKRLCGMEGALASFGGKQISRGCQRRLVSISGHPRYGTG